MINTKPGENDSSGIVGILARALIKRRKDIREDTTEEDWE